MSDDRVLAAEGRSLRVKAPESAEPSSRKAGVTLASERERADETEGSTRIQIVLPAQSVLRLNSLKRMTEAASSSEVIRNAIRVYEGLVKEVAENGSHILIQEKDGTLSRIKIF
jgi:hypothetical protein